MPAPSVPPSASVTRSRPAAAPTARPLRRRHGPAGFSVRYLRKTVLQMRGDGGRRAEMLLVAAAVLLFAAAVLAAALALASDEELTTARDDLIPPLLAASALS